MHTIIALFMVFDETFPINSLYSEIEICLAWRGVQDIEYLKLYSSRFGREEGLHLLEKTGMYLGPERYTHEHLPIDVMRGEVFRTCRSECSY